MFPNPNLTAIVKPNVDTLYSACWIDHQKEESLILTVPDTTEGLYYLFPLMDAWTNIVQSPGWRTTGKEELSVLIEYLYSDNVDPNPDAYDLVIKSPTSIAYLLGRTNVANQHDLRPTQDQMFSYRLKKNSAEVNANSTDKELGKTNPVDKIFSMTAREYFNTFANLMLTNLPILPQDSNIVSKMQSEYGLTAGQRWEYSSLTASQQKQLMNGVTKGIDMMSSYPITRVNGWTMPSMATGNYSTDYYLRAYIGLVLYAANVPQDAVYYETEMFAGGGNSYELLFPAKQTPPTNQFWSVTMYSDVGYLVPNENGTYSVSSQQDLKYREDGSLHVTISINQPENMSDTNWLPAPQAGEDFQLTMRVYWPQDDILNGVWTPPPVTQIKPPLL